MDLYSEALKIYPSGCEHESAVCYANRAACYMKMVCSYNVDCLNIDLFQLWVLLQDEHQSVIDDCTKGISFLYTPHS